MTTWFQFMSFMQEFHQNLFHRIVVKVVLVMLIVLVKLSLKEYRVG